MRYICDVPGGKTWFRLETDAEATRESELMRHAVEKFFHQERDKAAKTFEPPSKQFIEQEIGLKAHIQRTMPMFLSLRDAEGKPLVTAMLPPAGKEGRGFAPIIVGAANGDPYPAHGEAIRALGAHFGVELDRARCYPYRR